MRIESVNKDNSHTWVRICHGLNKLITDLNNNEQETSEMQFEEFALRLNASDFASRSEAKAKPQKRYFASSSTRTIPIGERTWTDVEPGKQSLSDYPVSKNLIHLLRHGSLPRDNDIIGLTKSGRAAWQEAEETRKDTVQIHQEQSCTSELFKAIQDAVSFDPTLQDYVLIPNKFFEYIHHIGCAINLRSIMNSGWIPGGQNLSNRQTVFFLPVNPMNTEIRTKSTWKHRVLHGTSIQHGRNIKTRCIGSISDLL